MPYCTTCGAEEQEGQRLCTTCGALSPQGAPVMPSVVESEGGVPLAGFWWRALGLIIDSAILLVPSALIAASVHDYWARKGAGVVVALLYATLFIGLQGRTPGMAVVKLKCVAVATGQIPGINRALVRAAYVGVLGSFVAIYHGRSFTHPITHEQKVHNATVVALNVLLELPLLLSYLWAAWDGRRQTLYDKVAGTVVTREVTKPATPRARGTITFDQAR